jgi:3-deoxy-7-phosphoheptulonate synthase
MHVPDDWSPQSWISRPNAQPVDYPDAAARDAVLDRLRKFPPLVTSWEIERLKGLLAEAQEGRRFVLQGGDCAEMLADCRPERITNKLKILLQMSLVLGHGLQKPIVRIGRFAGQYAKPRTSPTETRAGSILPSYFGDLINAAEFDAAARRPEPERMLRGYEHAAMTLNFVRSLVEGGFADLHHPEYWDLSFVSKASLPEELRAEYQRTIRGLGESIRFMESMSERRIQDVTRVDFYTSHEGLNLFYESAQTRRVPRREGFYCLTAHLPWIGERTRAVSGAHVEFFRGVRNPVGVKIGPTAKPGELKVLAEMLNPADEPGKLIFITRLGAGHARELLPRLIDGARGRRVLWLCDPMHGNTRIVNGGTKTRSFDDIRAELDATIDAHHRAGSRLGGVHIELTGEDVTECLGGEITEAELHRNYASGCDPRLNYQQSLELAFALARRMSGRP